MGYARALVQLNRDSLIPQDLSVNTWYFEPPGDVASSGADIVTALDTFYNAIEGVLSVTLTGTGTVKIYNLEDPSPRVPVHEGLITFAPAVNSYPAEVAVCLSYHAAQISGESQARRRGRVYIGPLASSAGSLDSSDVRPSSSLRTSFANAATALMGTAGINWSVFSPTTAGPEPWGAGQLGPAFAPVVGGWIDNSFDTQRRRGVATTARTVWG